MSMHKYDNFFQIFTIGDTYAQTIEFVETYVVKKIDPLFGN